MIYELRTYTLLPGGVREYMRIYNAQARDIQTAILGRLVCLLQPESGDLNQLIFLWAFDCHDERTARRSRLLADPGFAEFRKAVKGLLVRQESQLLSVI